MCQRRRPTITHIPIPHAAVVEALVDTLSHRQISVVEEEFAVSKDGMEMFDAFTSALKELDPIPQFRATAKLGRFLGGVPSNESSPPGPRNRDSYLVSRAAPRNNMLCIKSATRGVPTTNDVEPVEQRP